MQDSRNRRASLSQRLDALESRSAGERRSLVLLVGPDGPDAKQQGQIAEAEAVGLPVHIIELVPGCPVS